MEERFREITLEKRDCDVCGSQDLKSLWSYTKNVCANGFANGYSFKVNNVICCNCGFTFVSPRFNEEALADYYGTSLRSPVDQPLDYDISFRMDTINRFRSPRTETKPRFIEIGPSTLGEFQELVGESFAYQGIEPSSAFGGEWKKVQDFKEANLADIVAHYFVLEHISNPLKFLNECNRLLKMNGVMIVEVPNIAIYPLDPSALHLFEHQSHFSMQTLEVLASKAGFVQVEGADKSSRSFGMTAVFRKNNEVAALKHRDLLESPSEYHNNMRFFDLGLAKVNRYHESILQAKMFIEQAEGEAIILWGANQNLVDFLAQAYPDSNLPDSLVFIDSDPRKRRLLLDYDSLFGKMVFVPDDCIEAIKKSCRIICFTRRHQQTILDSIFRISGKRYKDQDILTVDINP